MHDRGPRRNHVTTLKAALAKVEVAAERERGRADGLNQDDVAWRELALAKAEAATVPALKTALAASRDQTEETDRGASGRPDGKSFHPLEGCQVGDPPKARLRRTAGPADRTGVSLRQSRLPPSPTHSRTAGDRAPVH